MWLGFVNNLGFKWSKCQIRFKYLPYIFFSIEVFIQNKIIETAWKGGWVMSPDWTYPLYLRHISSINLRGSASAKVGCISQLFLANCVTERRKLFLCPLGCKAEIQTDRRQMNRRKDKFYLLLIF